MKRLLLAAAGLALAWRATAAHLEDFIEAERAEYFERREAERDTRIDTEHTQLLDEEAAKDAARRRHPGGQGGALVDPRHPSQGPGAPPPIDT